MSIQASSLVPRLALRVGEAAEALGVSADFFAERVAPEVRWVRRGSVKLVAVSELQAWLDREARRTLDEADLRFRAGLASSSQPFSDIAGAT